MYVRILCGQAVLCVLGPQDGLLIFSSQLQYSPTDLKNQFSGLLFTCVLYYCFVVNVWTSLCRHGVVEHRACHLRIWENPSPLLCQARKLIVCCNNYICMYLGHLKFCLKKNKNHIQDLAISMKARPPLFNYLCGNPQHTCTSDNPSFFERKYPKTYYLIH